MAKQAITKPSRPVTAVALADALYALMDRFAGALVETVSLSAELGAIAREAAPQLDSESVGPFVEGCHQMCAAHGLEGPSVKVYLSNMRGVLRAMVAGWQPDAGCETLRAMYDAIPAEQRGQGANKGGARKPRQPVAGESAKGSEVAAVKAAPAAKADLIRALFGFHTEELQAAVEYATEHSGIFQTWAKASAKAAQAEIQPLRKAA
jgi:hypothetical protein